MTATNNNMDKSTKEDNPPAEVTEVTEPYHKGISIEHIIEYKKKGLSHAAIAKLLDCDKSNITNRLKKYEEEIDTLDLHKEHGADILTMTGRNILKHLTQAKLEKATAYQLVGMYGIIHQQEQLKRGNTGQSNSINIVIQAIKSACSDAPTIESKASKVEVGE